ncbi:MAG: DUF808 family protein [Bacteriovoracaceae bacterium]|nr:DUF808 family protein [Bacteriovoracaceae bacterium]
MFSLLTLLDDVATTLDDVAAMTKVAMGKTSALMSDDLAVNAGVIHGVNPDREIPMVKAIFLGSLLNKLICIVCVLLLMAIYPPLLTAILFLGGLYLSYEGAHKVLEKVFHTNIDQKKKQLSEKQKIKGAVKTDLILSIEIIVIAKSTLTGSILEQTLSLCLIGLLASVLIYGLVALIVKFDDFGLFLIKKGYPRLGRKLVYAMPYLMKFLGVLGTTAMFLVGGGIINHTFHVPLITLEIIQNLLVGALAGLIICGIFSIFSKLAEK